MYLICFITSVDDAVVVFSVVSSLIHCKLLFVHLQLEFFQKHKTIAGFPGAAAYDGPSLLEEECDILCPCATENVITAENAPRIKARIIAEGANGPTTFDAHQILLERKVYHQ